MALDPEAITNAMKAVTKNLGGAKMAKAAKTRKATSKAKASKPRAPKAPVEMKPCGCGCGKKVARRYAPGHDARHKGRLIKLVREGSPAQREKAKQELRSLDWGKYIPKV